MIFALSKILAFLLNPMVWIIAGLVIGFFKKSKTITTGAIIALMVLSNPLLINIVTRKWEPAPKSKDQLPICDAAVLLTGMTHPNYLPADQLHFSQAVDRVTETLTLYNSGIVRKIIISGGSSQLISPEQIESIKIKDFLLINKVKAYDILLDTASRNTYENAFFTKKILTDRELYNRTVLLITSAFHMPRAEKCFVKQGMNIVTYPVDYQSEELHFHPKWLIPSPDALAGWQRLFKEWVGLLVYRMIGYA